KGLYALKDSYFPGDAVHGYAEAMHQECRGSRGVICLTGDMEFVPKGRASVKFPESNGAVSALHVIVFNPALGCGHVCQNAGNIEQTLFQGVSGLVHRECGHAGACTAKRSCIVGSAIGIRKVRRDVAGTRIKHRRYDLDLRIDDTIYKFARS